MSHDWSAEVTNDPDRDYELMIELLEDGTPRGRVYKDPAGQIILMIYKSADHVELNLNWLIDVFNQVKI